MKNLKSNDHSFIILAFEESPYLCECINSLKNQSVASQILIATSTPNKFISTVAREYNLPLFINKKQTGLAGDWNFALNLSKTNYVTLAHQDDVYERNYVEEMLKDLDDNENFLIKFSNYSELFNKNGENCIRSNSLNLLIKKVIIFFNYQFKKELKTKKQKINLLGFGSPIPCPSVLYNKSLLKNFKFDPNFTINVDWQAWICMSQMDGSFLKTHQHLLLHRIHKDSETSKGIFSNKRYYEDLSCFEQLWPKNIAKFLQKIYKLSYRSNFK